MKKKRNAVVALVLAAAFMCGLLTGCGSGKKVEAGDYSGSVVFSHPMEVEYTSFGGTAVEQVDQWGADVAISIDEDGVIWNIQVSAPEGATLALGMWEAHSGKFISSITGNYTCQQIMGIVVDVEDDGFPVLNGDCSGIHQPDGVTLTLLNDFEAACAMTILAIQDAVATNGLA